MPFDEVESDIMDDAARAGWLYYVGGRTQEEIAKTLGVSRQRAQRLVAKSVADGLIQVRLNHPVAKLMELGQSLREAYGLKRVRIAPDIGVDGNMRSLGPFAAGMMESVLQSKAPRVVGFGTGRALRAAVDNLQMKEAPQHRLLSVVGNVAPDGSANFYDVLMRVADIVRAPHYPLMTPVLAASEAERHAYMQLSAVQKSYQLAKEMDAVFIGVGQYDETAPQLLDGFLSQEDWQGLRAQGAVGEICGHPYDADGNYLHTDFTSRVTSIPVQACDEIMVVAIAAGSRKIEPIRAALKGKKFNALVTDEPTAVALLG